MNIINIADVPAMPWRNGGGVTREMLAWPSSAAWTVRLSVADIASDGPFSAFPDVERAFAIIDGQGVVLTWPEKSLTIQAGDTPVAFDGGLPPMSHLLAGPVRDLNLMCRLGRAKLWPATDPWTPRMNGLAGLFTGVAGRWTDGLQSIPVPALTLLWTADPSGCEWSFLPDQPAKQMGWWFSHEDVQR